MAFKIEEKFDLNAPVEKVWAFLIDPARVVICIPGAELLEVQDERTFLGATKVKVGPIAMSFKGTVKFTELDETTHTVRMVAEARELGGAGSAKVTMVSNVTALPDGSAVVVEAEVDLVGKIVQFGRGMIQEVSRQLFRQFSSCVKQHLESVDQARQESNPTSVKPEPVSAAAVGFKALWAVIARFFKRLVGSSSSAD